MIWASTHHACTPRLDPRSGASTAAPVVLGIFGFSHSLGLGFLHAAHRYPAEIDWLGLCLVGDWLGRLGPRRASGQRRRSHCFARHHANPAGQPSAPTPRPRILRSRRRAFPFLRSARARQTAGWRRLVLPRSRQTRMAASSAAPAPPLGAGWDFTW
jgi:hypothetical protein